MDEAGKESKEDTNPKKPDEADVNYHPDLLMHIHRHMNVTQANFSVQWKQLEEQEKLYAYYISKAGFAGGKMVFHQISYESPAIFLILQGYFNGTNFDLLQQNALKNGGI